MLVVMEKFVKSHDGTYVAVWWHACGDCGLESSGWTSCTVVHAHFSCASDLVTSRVRYVN